MKILFEDQNLLVIDKPPYKDVAGVVKELGGSYFLAHRLDKDTSGILVLAKNEKTLKAMQSQWKKREVKKTYIALVKGHLTPKQGKIEAPISRQYSDRKKMGVSGSSLAREAETEYKVLKYLNFDASPVTLLHAFPKTGRTHQIRVHFAAIKHPVVGDKTYGDPKLNKKFEQYGVERQFLHATELTFFHPITKGKLQIKSPLPNDITLKF